MKNQSCKIPLTFKYKKDGNTWVARCVETSSSSYDTNLRRLKKDFPLFVAEHIEEILKVYFKERK